MSLCAKALHVRRGPRDVIEGVDLELHPGEVVALLGPNGAGKSSLLGALCGELRPQSGEVLVDGPPLRTLPPLVRARRLAVLPQEPGLAAPFRAHEVVALGRSPWHPEPLAATAEAVDLAMAAADVTHLADRSYLALSGGERQRVHLARVLAQLHAVEGPRYLLLDEPTSSLDLAHQHRTLEAARALSRSGAGVLVALHDLNLAARHADRVAVLEGGRLRALGTPREALREPLLREVFGVPLRVGPHPDEPTRVLLW